MKYIKRLLPICLVLITILSMSACNRTNGQENATSATEKTWGADVQVTPNQNGYGGEGQIKITFKVTYASQTSTAKVTVNASSATVEAFARDFLTDPLGNMAFTELFPYGVWELNGTAMNVNDVATVLQDGDTLHLKLHMLPTQMGGSRSDATVDFNNSALEWGGSIATTPNQNGYGAEGEVKIGVQFSLNGADEGKGILVVNAQSVTLEAVIRDYLEDILGGMTYTETLAYGQWYLNGILLGSDGYARVLKHHDMLHYAIHTIPNDSGDNGDEAEVTVKIMSTGETEQKQFSVSDETLDEIIGHVISEAKNVNLELLTAKGAVVTVNNRQNVTGAYRLQNGDVICIDLTGTDFDPHKNWDTTVTFLWSNGKVENKSFTLSSSMTLERYLRYYLKIDFATSLQYGQWRINGQDVRNGSTKISGGETIFYRQNGRNNSNTWGTTVRIKITTHDEWLKVFETEVPKEGMSLVSLWNDVLYPLFGTQYETVLEDPASVNYNDRLIRSEDFEGVTVYPDSVIEVYWWVDDDTVEQIHRYLHEGESIRVWQYDLDGEMIEWDYDVVTPNLTLRETILEFGYPYDYYAQYGYFYKYANQQRLSVDDIIEEGCWIGWRQTTAFPEIDLSGGYQGRYSITLGFRYGDELTEVTVWYDDYLEITGFFDRTLRETYFGNMSYETTQSYGSWSFNGETVDAKTLLADEGYLEFNIHTMPADGCFDKFFDGSIGNNSGTTGGDSGTTGGDSGTTGGDSGTTGGDSGTTGGDSGTTGGDSGTTGGDSGTTGGDSGTTGGDSGTTGGDSGTTGGDSGTTGGDSGTTGGDSGTTDDGTHTHEWDASTGTCSTCGESCPRDHTVDAIYGPCPVCGFSDFAGGGYTHLFFDIYQDGSFFATVPTHTMPGVFPTLDEILEQAGLSCFDVLNATYVITATDRASAFTSGSEMLQENTTININTRIPDLPPVLVEYTIYGARYYAEESSWWNAMKDTFYAGITGELSLNQALDMLGLDIASDDVIWVNGERVTDINNTVISADSYIIAMDAGISFDGITITLVNEKTGGRQSFTYRYPVYFAQVREALIGNMDLSGMELALTVGDNAESTWIPEAPIAQSFTVTVREKKTTVSIKVVDTEGKVKTLEQSISGVLPTLGKFVENYLNGAATDYYFATVSGGELCELSADDTVPTYWGYIIARSAMKEEITITYDVTHREQGNSVGSAKVQGPVLLYYAFESLENANIFTEIFWNSYSYEIVLNGSALSDEDKGGHFVLLWSDCTLTAKPCYNIRIEYMGEMVEMPTTQSVRVSDPTLTLAEVLAMMNVDTTKFAFDMDLAKSVGETFIDYDNSVIWARPKAIRFQVSVDHPDGGTMTTTCSGFLGSVTWQELIARYFGDSADMGLNASDYTWFTLDPATSNWVELTDPNYTWVYNAETGSGEYSIRLVHKNLSITVMVTDANGEIVRESDEMTVQNGVTVAEVLSQLGYDAKDVLRIVDMMEGDLSLDATITKRANLQIVLAH